MAKREEIFQNLRHAQVSAYYLQVKEYSERLEWTPNSSSSSVSSLLQKHFDQCLTADALNEIESTIHQVCLFPRIVVSLTLRSSWKNNSINNGNIISRYANNWNISVNVWAKRVVCR